MNKKLLPIVLMVAALVVVVVYSSGFKFYASSTVQTPGGLFLVVARQPTVGDYVEVCLPRLVSPYGLLHQYLKPGLRCPDKTAPTFKKVKALAGDTVELNADSVVINKKALTDSATREKDDKGFDIPAIERNLFILKSEEIWLYYANDKSWDSRYYGPIDKQYIVRVLKPVMTW